MIIFLSCILLSIALYFALVPVTRHYETRVKKVEEEWIKMVQQDLANEFLFVDPKRMRTQITWISIVGIGLAILFRTPLPILAGATLVWGLPQIFLKLIQRRRQRLFEAQLGTALPQISSILHAGHTFERALEALIRTQPNPLAQELTMVLKAIRLGHTMDAALEALLERFPNADLEVVVRAVGISRRVGSNLAEAFDRVAEMIRTRTNMRNRLRGLTAQGRIQAWVSIAMPVMLMIILNFIDPEYLRPLFSTPIGLMCLAGCAVMLTIGGIWVHKIGSQELMR